jgi:hypothetical protein
MADLARQRLIAALLGTPAAGFGPSALLRPAAPPQGRFDGDFSGRVYTPEEIMGGWAPQVLTEGNGIADLSRLEPSPGFAEYLRRAGY